MHYQQGFPTQALSDYIDRFWQLSANELSQVGPTETIIPDGCTELIINWGDAFERKNTSGTYHRQDPSFLVGQIQQGLQIRSTGTIGLFAIRFKSNGLYPFFHGSMHELTGHDLPLERIFPQNGSFLEDAILAADSFEERQIIAEHFLLAKQGRAFGTQPILDEAVRQIRQASGQLTMRDLADDLGASQRQLERYFKRCIGLSAKQYARIVKFQHTLSTLESGVVQNWAQLALEGGYYDQAHFIHEFKHFTGQSPRHFFRSDHPLADFFWQLS